MVVGSGTTQCMAAQHCIEGDFFCIEAFLERHGHGHRQQHTQLQLHGSAVYRFGQPLPAEEVPMERGRRESINE